MSEVNERVMNKLSFVIDSKREGVCFINYILSFRKLHGFYVSKGSVHLFYYSLIPNFRMVKKKKGWVSKGYRMLTLHSPSGSSVKLGL